MAAIQQPAPASDLERRKQLKLRLRGDLTITPQKYEGRTYYVVKDPVSLRYYRFKEQEHFLIRLMDGTHTLDESQKAFEERFRPDRLTLEDLEQFGQQLLKAGLVQNEFPQSGQQLFEQRNKRKKKELLQKFTNILYIKIPIFDPERLLVRMLPYFRFVFTGWFFFASIIFMLSALMLVLTHFETFRERLPSFHEFFSLKTVVYLWAALGVVKVIHEFGHGLSCKAFGGEVHEMGFLFLCLSPAMYCNVSDAWTLPSKWKRIIISFAGIYVELMIAALATFVWWNTPGQPFINYMALSLMVVCSVSTVVFNGNPLMRFDGYYVLADWIEIPNLREKATRYLHRVFQERCLGIELQPEPYMALGRRILFITYAIASWLYRWMITFVILYFIANFLKPYKLEVLSQMLALFALGSMFGWPLVNMVKNLKKRGRLPDMKMLNTSITLTVLVAIILGFFLLPLPVSRVRQSGVVEVNPLAIEPVRVKVSGILKDIHVKEGQQVKKGAVLATFSNMELDNNLESLESEYYMQKQIVEDLNLLASQTPSQSKKSLTQEIATAANEMNMAKSQLDWKLQFSDDRMRVVPQSDGTVLIQLLAPRAGIVMGLPKEDAIGKLIEKDQPEPFCQIGDPKKLHVLLPVSPDDHDLLSENLAKLEQGKITLPIVIRVQGRGSKTFTGRLTDLPKSVAKEIPLPISNKGGGPIAVKPTSEPDHLIPQTQVYLVSLDFVDADNAILPGSRAQVKIYCEYRSAAWWLWRTIAKTFDIRLM